MSLVQKISDLATAIGSQIKVRITAEHPCVAKAWVCFGYVGEQMVIRAAYNVQGVTRLGVGKYRVYFAHALLDANYAWLATARDGGAQAPLQFAGARLSEELKTTDFIDVVCASPSGKFSDTPEMSLMVLR